MRDNKKGKTILNLNDFTNYLYKNVDSIKTKKDAIAIGRSTKDFFYEKLYQDCIIEFKKLFTMEKYHFEGKNGVLNVKEFERKYEKGKGASIKFTVKKILYSKKPRNKIKFKASETLEKLINEEILDSDNGINKD